MLEIREAIQRIVKSEEELYSAVAKVTAVDEEARTINIQPIDGSAEIFDVKLQANISGTTGVVQIPTINSYVVATFLSKDTAFISLFTDLDKILIDTEEVTINGGNNGGLVNINDLVSKLNAVENDLNNLKAAFSAWIPVPTDGGAALKAALASYFAATLTPTVTADLEDTKITH
jgi:hypothetical protein